MAKEEEDVEIIRNVLSVQHVSVVGTLDWDKLQFLLNSLCNRISSQADRLEKAEEQGKSLASFKYELNQLSQNAAAAAKAEAQKEEKFWEKVEARLKAVEDVTAPLQAIPNLASLAGLGDMPKRMSVVEDGLEDTNIQVKQIDSKVREIDSHVHQIDNDLQELDSEFTNKEAKGGGMDNTGLTERIKLLEQQFEEFQELMDKITKAHTADLEAIQKVQRTFRAELEAKPVGQHIEGGGNNLGLNELQKRLERKVDVDVVEQLIRASTNTKEGLEALTRIIEELKNRLRKSARFSIKMDGNEGDLAVNSGGSNNSRGDDYGPRVEKLEEELATLTNKLSTKVDRATIDEIQLKIASGGDVGANGGDGALKDLIAKKVDRAEMLEQMKDLRDGGNMKEVMGKINALNNSIATLAERSDLGVLLAKRAEQIAHPAETIHGVGGHTDDEEIQMVVNEHANRIMVYADMLLQMQVILATKADNSALMTLRNIVENLQAEGGKNSKATLEAQETTQDQMRITLKSHEKMLMKLLEDVGILGKGVLIMSGHDNEFHPNNISPSPIFTTPTQGTISSIPMTPNLEGDIGSEGILKSTSSTPTSPPSSPNVQAKRISISTKAIEESKPLANEAKNEPLVSKTPQPSTNLALEAIIGAPTTASDSINRKQSITPTRKNSRFGSPGSTIRDQGSMFHITNIQEAHKVVAETKYRETLSVIEDAIDSKKIEPKENVAVLKRLVLELEKISLELENNLILIQNLEQIKVDKIDFQALAKIVRELKAMESAMLSGKPILGFKCMSCNHDLERLIPTKGPTIPTRQMPRSQSSMLSAERIFAVNKQDIFPMRSPPTTLEANIQSSESTKITKKQSIVAQSKT